MQIKVIGKLGKNDLHTKLFKNRLNTVNGFLRDLISSAEFLNFAVQADKVKVFGVNEVFKYLDVLDKANGSFTLGMLEYIVRRTVLVNPALIHIKYTIGNLSCKAHFVCNDHHRKSLTGKLTNYRLHFSYHSRIQRRGRLVKQYHLRLHCQRSRNSHTLFLSTGKLIRIIERLIRKTYHTEKLHSLIICLLLGSF